MIVVDSNILIYFHIQGDYTEKTEKLFKLDAEWVAPYLWRSECANVLALYVRQNLLSLASAIQKYEAMHQLMIGHEYHPNITNVLTLAQQSGRSAYDCEFVALAQQLNAQLVTVDKKVVNSFPQTAVSLDNLFVA